MTGQLIGAIKELYPQRSAQFSSLDDSSRSSSRTRTLANELLRTFVGRNKMIEDVLERTDAAKLVLVVGCEGIGKSAFLSGLWKRQTHLRDRCVW